MLALVMKIVDDTVTIETEDGVIEGPREDWQQLLSVAGLRVQTGRTAIALPAILKEVESGPVSRAVALQAAIDAGVKRRAAQMALAGALRAGVLVELEDASIALPE